MYSESKGAHPQALWQKYFPATVSGKPFAQYLTWRCLPRPRDVLYLIRQSVAVAINRHHGIVEALDVHRAEESYSQFATDAARVEGSTDLPNIEEVLFEFAGEPPVLEEPRLRDILGKATDSHDFERVKEELLRLSFIGPETNPGQFEYYDDPRRRAIISNLATKLAERRGSSPRFQIHPAFRPYLQIKDDYQDSLEATGFTAPIG